MRFGLKKREGEKLMYLKVHEGQKGKVVAVCDRELLGRVFESGGAVLDLALYKDFYKGDLTGEEEVAKALANFWSANLVGEKAVGCALKLGLARKEDVIYIAGVPHLQLYRL